MSDQSPAPAAKPTPRITRVSIGQMMAVVAACAAVSGTSPEVLVLVVGGTLLPLAWLIAAVGRLLGENRVPFFSTGAGLAVMVILANWLKAPDFSELVMFVCLTVVNASGPIVLADRCLHRKPLTSGHLLWAWAGVVWLLPFFLNSTLRPAGSIQVLMDSTRLLLAAVILLLAFARRPTGAEDVGTDRAGWLVVECDLIAWSWIAARIVKWV